MRPPELNLTILNNREIHPNSDPLSVDTVMELPHESCDAPDPSESHEPATPSDEPASSIVIVEDSEAIAEVPKIVDPGVMVIRSGVRRHRRSNKATLRARRNQFDQERTHAAAEEAASVSEDSLRLLYADLSRRWGRRPDETELMATFRTPRASQKAAEIAGDFTALKRQADEDVAWEDYWRARDGRDGPAVDIDTLPDATTLWGSLHEKWPADWTRDDFIAAYLAASKHSGHWLSGGELQYLCKTGFLPLRYKNITDMFGEASRLTSEAQQVAAWHTAQKERESRQSSAQPEETTIPEADIAADKASESLPPKGEDPRGELYSAIIDRRQIPKVPGQPARGEKVRIEVLDDCTLSIGGKRVTLEGHKLFALNALLLNPWPATANELRDLGFDPAAKAGDFTRAVKSLATILERMTGYGLVGILSRGKSTLYALSPNLVITDSRQLRKKLTNKPMEVTQLSGAIDEADTEAALAEYQDSEREAAIAEIVKKYQFHPKVWKKMEEFKVGTPAKINVLEGDGIQSHIDYASQFPLLDISEEQALCDFIERGLSVHAGLSSLDNLLPKDEEALINLVIAQRVLYASNLRLVISIAARFTGTGMFALNDSVQYGMLGLDKAISRFDHTLGYKFSTYATWWIRQAIGRAHADEGRAIRLPVYAHDNWIKINKAARDLSAVLHREPTTQELAHYVGMTPRKVEATLEAGRVFLPSLDRQIEYGEDKGSTLGDLIPDRRISTDRFVEQLSARVEVNRLFSSKKLDDRQKLILALRYGVYDHLSPDLEVRTAAGRKVKHAAIIGRLVTTDGLTLDRVGRILGISRERVRQIEKDAKAIAELVIQENRGPAPSHP